MDRARRVGGVLWVAGGLGFQLVWFLREAVVPGPVTLALCAMAALLALVALSGSAWGSWLAGWVVAGSLGLDFGGAVADRFGVFGPPGAPGVSWGGWRPFVDDTARLLPDVGLGLASGAAVAATVVEVVLAALLLSGWQRRWVGKAAAGLLVVYLVSMATALGAQAVATYALPTLVGAALLVSTCSARRPGPAPRVALPRSRCVRREGAS